MTIEARAEGQHPLKSKCPKTESAEQEKKAPSLGSGALFPAAKQAGRMDEGEEAKAYGTIVRAAAKVLDMSTRTTARYLKRLVSAGLVALSGGLYWVVGQAAAGSKEA